jgi:hypothetical protein
MRGHIACPQTPLGGWIRERNAILSIGENPNLLAALTLSNNRMAGAAIKLAALLGHKNALLSYFNGSANHGNHILSL